MAKNKMSDDRDILLVRDQKSGTLQAVAGIGKDGKIKTVKPVIRNDKHFLSVDKNSTELATFFKNLTTGTENHTDAAFFKVPMNGIDRGVEILETMLNHQPDARIVTESRVQPQEYTGEHQEAKVILMQDDDGKLKALVQGEDGRFRKVDPTKENADSFFKIDSGGNAMENFHKKFVAQFKAPSHTGLYGVCEKAVDKMAMFLEKIIGANPQDNVLKPYRIDPEAALNSKPEATQAQGEQEAQRYQPLDLNRLDWNQVDKLGIKGKDLQDALKSMSYGYLSPGLIPVNMVMNGDPISINARLSLAVQPDGGLKLALHPYQQEPDFAKPFQGILFTARDIEQFKQSGHGGRVFELEPVPGGGKVPSLVSLDPMTNRLEAVLLAGIRIGQMLKGVSLSEQQQQGLATGKAVWVEGMDKRVKAGEQPQKIDRFVQYNAVKRGLDFKFSPEQKQAHDRKRRQDKTEEQKPLKPRRVGEVWVRPMQGGVELSRTQFEKVCNREAVFIEGMSPQKSRQDTAGAQKVEDSQGKGQVYNAWVWVDESKGHVRHTSKTPEEVRAIEAKQAAKEGQHLKPAAGYQTPYTVNTGQTRPAEKQAERRTQHQPLPKPKINKGHKM